MSWQALNLDLTRLVFEQCVSARCEQATCVCVEWRDGIQTAREQQKRAFEAARTGDAKGLHALHSQSGAWSLLAVNENGESPAHPAALNGQAASLRVLYELGAKMSLSAAQLDIVKDCMHSLATSND